MSTEKTWQKKATDHYSRVADILLPNRQKILSIIGRAATILSPDSPRILDIGCGYGDVTAEVLRYAPQASVCMIDFSEEMVQRSAERFQRNKDIHVLRYDLNEGLPDRLQPQEFDAVVSCFALHHVALEQRVPLYSQIYHVLKADGVFVNGDRFQEHSPSVHTWVFDEWVTWMQRQIQEKMGKERTFEEVKAQQMVHDERLGDKPETIWAMQRDLKQVGFAYVDCLFKAYHFGVIVATNQ